MSKQSRNQREKGIDPACIYLYEEYSISDPGKKGETIHLVLNIGPESWVKRGDLDGGIGEHKNQWIKEGSKEVFAVGDEGNYQKVLADLWPHIQDIPYKEKGSWSFDLRIFKKFYSPEVRPQLTGGIKKYLTAAHTAGSA